MDPKVRYLARDVRDWAIRNQRRFSSHPDLAGMCAISSAELYRRIKANCSDTTSVKLGLAEQRDYLCHVFVIVNNKHIVDVTATQFSARRKAIEIQPVFHFLHPWYWRVHKTFESDELLYMQQIKDEWPSWQVCEVKGAEIAISPPTGS